MKVLHLCILFLFARHLLAAGPSIESIRHAATPVVSGKRVVQQVAIFVNGRPLRFGNTQLEMRRGRLYVPLRAISEAVGAIVRYQPNTQTITIQRGQRVVQLHTKVTPRVLVPLRFLSENLGAQINLQRGSVRGVNEIYINWIDEQFAPPIAINPPVVTAPSQPTPSIPNAPSRPDATLQAAIHHNLNQLNAYRARAGAQALQLDPRLNAFAHQGSLELSRNHIPHGHFQKRDVSESGFTGGAAENQGDPNGWPIRGGLNATIDAILQAMIDEGPGGGHHDNMLNPKFRRVGIGLVVVGNELYLTNDFSQ